MSNKVPHHRSPYAMKFEARSHEETERQQRYARSKAWNLAKKHLQAQRKRQGCILLSRLGMGTPSCVNKKSRWKESLLLIQERVCIRSVRKTLTLLSCGPWGHQEVRRRWWRPTARCKQEKSDSICQTIGLLCQGYASWRNSRSSFLGKTLWGSWVYIPLDQRSKTTSHQKWQENWLQKIQLCAICSSWFISVFFLNYAFTYFFIIFITGFRIWFQQIHRKYSTRKKWKYEWRASVRPAAWIHRNRKQK